MQIKIKFIGLCIFILTSYLCIDMFNNNRVKTNEQVLINSGLAEINYIELKNKNETIEFKLKNEQWIDKFNVFTTKDFKILENIINALKYKEMISVTTKEKKRYGLDNNEQLSIKLIKNNKLLLHLRIGNVASNKHKYFIHFDNKKTYMIDQEYISKDLEKIIRLIKQIDK